MNHIQLKFGFILLLALGISAAPQAADIEAGKSLSANCSGCHGNGGLSKNAMFPTLAGQTPLYIENQLKHFRAGQRSNASMNAVAQDLSDQDIRNLAAYFAGQPGQSAGGDPQLAQAGKDKAAMCMGCHGSNLQGKGQFPKLAGQYPAYLAKQLKAFKTGERKAGPMNAIGQSLTDTDIEALAAYLSGLPAQ